VCLILFAASVRNKCSMRTRLSNWTCLSWTMQVSHTYASAGAVEPTGLVKAAGEQLQTNDGVDNDDEYYEQRDVKQRHHSFENRVQNNLKTCN